MVDELALDNLVPMGECVAHIIHRRNKREPKDDWMHPCHSRYPINRITLKVNNRITLKVGMGLSFRRREGREKV
jgi:hypothetical protein